MTQAKLRFRTLAEYAALDPSDLPEGRYELVNGELVDMGAENLQNVIIAGFIFSVLLQFVPSYLIHLGTEIAVSSRNATSRFPDLMVITEETLNAMQLDRRSLVMPQMPAPALVIEVVSPGQPGTENYDRDYVEKPAEYAARGIPEFWQVDPDRAMVTVLWLEQGVYQPKVFRGADLIVSPTFPALTLTAAQILTAGRC
jgi:Uma2 family endonuclease